MKKRALLVLVFEDEANPTPPEEYEQLKAVSLYQRLTSCGWDEDEIVFIAPPGTQHRNGQDVRKNNILNGVHQLIGTEGDVFIYISDHSTSLSEPNIKTINDNPPPNKKDITPFQISNELIPPFNFQKTLVITGEYSGDFSQRFKELQPSWTSIGSRFVGDSRTTKDFFWLSRSMFDCCPFLEAANREAVQQDMIANDQHPSIWP